jgi:hypothetical protein
LDPAMVMLSVMLSASGLVLVLVLERERTAAE